MKINLQALFFIDFQKAFDVIKHSVLLQKLEILKLPPDFVSLMSSFLTDRKQCVVINDKMSRLIPTNYGVPQVRFLVLFYSLSMLTIYRVF